MINYGPTIENINLIVDKAKSKADGVFTFRGVEYLVKDGRFTHYATGGKIYERCGFFVVQIGSYEYRSDARKLLKGI